MELAMANKSKFRDQALLFLAALAVCVIGGAIIWLGEIYHLSPLWWFLLCSSIVFIAVVGKNYRNQLRKPAFLAFMILWLFIHLVVFAVFLIYSSWMYWALLVPFELWVGYIVAYSLFGVLPEGKESEKGNQ